MSGVGAFVELDDHSRRLSSSDLRMSMIISWANLASFALYIVVDLLTGLGFLSATTVAEVANKYLVTILPAPASLQIWFVIYLLLAAFTISQVIPSIRNDWLILKQIGWLFTAAELLQTVWTVVWAQGTAVTSIFANLLFIAIVAVLAAIQVRVGLVQRALTGRVALWELLSVDLGLSILFGWATVASLINFSQGFLALGWDGAPLSADAWAIIILGAAACIYIAVIVSKENFVFGFIFPYAAMAIRARLGYECPVDSVPRLTESGCGRIRTTTLLLTIIVGVAAVGQMLRFCQKAYKLLA